MPTSQVGDFGSSPNKGIDMMYLIGKPGYVYGDNGRYWIYPTTDIVLENGRRYVTKPYAWSGKYFKTAREAIQFLKTHRKCLTRSIPLGPLAIYYSHRFDGD
jgi:hypothetical protein